MLFLRVFGTKPERPVVGWAREKWEHSETSMGRKLSFGAKKAYHRVTMETAFSSLFGNPIINSFVFYERQRQRENLAMNPRLASNL